MKNRNKKPSKQGERGERDTENKVKRGLNIKKKDRMYHFNCEKKSKQTKTKTQQQYQHKYVYEIYLHTCVHIFI